MPREYQPGPVGTAERQLGADRAQHVPVGRLRVPDDVGPERLVPGPDWWGRRVPGARAVNRLRLQVARQRQHRHRAGED